VILKCALELFFHGAHSMHMPQNSHVSVMPSSSSRSANDFRMRPLDELLVVSNAFVTCWKGAQAVVYEYTHV
jgi:hypothetical protein